MSGHKVRSLCFASVASAALLLAGAIAPPAMADVKQGVIAWQNGDYAAAIAQWRPLAIEGDPDAQFNLGQAYKLGRGVEMDLNQASQWFKKAAEQGHLQAADNYGLILFQNNQRAEAIQWISKSAERGEPRAQYVLGTAHFNGDLAEKDWVKAYALMTRASSQGLPQASKSLASMDNYIPLAQRQQAIALASRMEGDETMARERAMAMAANRHVASGNSVPAPKPMPAPVSMAEAPSAAAQYDGGMDDGPIYDSGVSRVDIPASNSAANNPAQDYSTQNYGAAQNYGAGQNYDTRQGYGVQGSPAPSGTPVRMASANPQSAASYASAYLNPSVRQDSPQPWYPDNAAPAAAYAAHDRPAATPPAAATPYAAPVNSAPVSKSNDAVVSQGPWRVQLGAYSSQSNANRAWDIVSGRHNMVNRFQPYLVDAGRLTRVQIGGFASRDAAMQICSQLRRAGQACFPIRN